MLAPPLVNGPALPRSPPWQGHLCLLVLFSPLLHRQTSGTVRRQSLLKAYPELHEKKGIGRSPFKELLESTLFLWELVIDLADVHSFEVGVTVARA